MMRMMWFCAVVLVVSAGCRSTSDRRPLCCGGNAPPPKAVFVPPPPPAPSPVIQQQQFQQQQFQQPGGGFPVQPQSPGPTPQAPSISKTPAERTETPWLPRETPEPEQRRDVPPRIQLYAPEPIDKDAPKKIDEPLSKPSADRSFPAIPQFAEAKDKVFAGLRPPLDGLDWLQKNGVQTVVQIRLFGEDDSAVRKEVEARSMKYVAFEVSPVTLTQEKADEFIKLIRDGSRSGVFVFDQDGSLAGSMWYVYMRQGEVLDDDASQLRARGLGLQAGRDGQHRDMWLAVQKLLSENNP